MEGKWLSISDYSDYRNISISTVRRYIKGERVKYKKENGKYFIHVSDENFSIRVNKKEREELSLRLEIHELKDRVRLLEEENNDLKMLVEIYESQLNIKKPQLPPQLPEELM